TVETRFLSRPSPRRTDQDDKDYRKASSETHCHSPKSLGDLEGAEVPGPVFDPEAFPAFSEADFHAPLLRTAFFNKRSACSVSLGSLAEAAQRRKRMAW